MNNNDIVAKRNQAIEEANKVYNQIINEQTKLVDNQSNQIDSYLSNSQSAINQSVNNNISALNNASETARRQHEAEKQAIMNNYQNNVSNVDETTRIGYLNSARNRIATSEGSLNDTIQEYNNQIAQAKITGESMIAQQALDMLKQKLNLYKTNIDTVNNLNIGRLENKQQLRSDYATIDAGYSNARNEYLDRQQDYNLFNKEMTYNKQQLNTQKKLKEQEYQLDLRDAKESYYRSRKASSSGGLEGYPINDINDTEVTNNNPQNNITTNTAQSDIEKFGTFSNGYQPKGVNGSKLSASGLKVWNVFDEGTSQKNATAFGKQNIWKDTKGNYWVWDGAIKDYIDVTKKVQSSQKNKVNYQWGR